MPFDKWRKKSFGGFRVNQKSSTLSVLINGQQFQQPERGNETIEIKNGGDYITIVYVPRDSPLDTVMTIIQSMNEIQLKIFTSENDAIEYISMMVDKKLFLVLDSKPTSTLLAAIESLPQVDSLFVYSSEVDTEPENDLTQNARVQNRCDNAEALANAIREAREGLEKQTAAFSLYNQKEKATRDLSKEGGSFLFFQMFKTVIMSMPKTVNAKEMMLSRCRDYYRGNTKELAHIAEFDQTYKSSEAIPWYTKESFLYKFINKALRTEDVEMLYYFRFYIIDLCKQLELRFNELKRVQTDVLKLYRGLKLSAAEVANFEQNVGNLISTNGYLSTSRLRTVAYTFAKKPINREGLVCALFEYQVDLTVVEKIVIADIAQFSAFPDEAEVLIDIGASFRIDSCTFDPDDNLWHVIVRATDQGAALANEYMEYQKKKMADANIVLMFGHLLVEMGEYAKAEKYFDTVLASNPNDEETACIYFNFGRAYRLKGDFERAADYYRHAFKLHNTARPKRFASAAKALNGLGVSISEQGDKEQAIECFEKALKFLGKSVQRNHVDVAGTMINLTSIYCELGEYDMALKYCLKATKIYKRTLPTAHPNNALAKISLANVYLGTGEYDAALEEYKHGMKMLETALPSDHPDRARSVHNLGLVYERQGDPKTAADYFEQAASIAERTLPAKHPLRTLIKNSEDRISDAIGLYPVMRL